MNHHSKQGMVDVSHKDITKRVAVASSKITLSPGAFQKLIKGQSPKGDVFEAARIAGMMAAKSTATVIPYCHSLSLSHVNIRFETDQRHHTVRSLAEVVCLGQTGVEMEALTAACVASLTIYDMMKWADKTMVISDVKLLKKTGGRSGNFQRKP
jgi:cyclic pyranopterin phosphate synthase